MTDKQSAQASMASKLKTESTSFARRDLLLKIEKEMQERWEQTKQNTVDAPKDTSKPKFLVTFPFPYMNGKLHLGHAFSMSKAEFQARYQRLQGKEALFPFGFHCTGMPIVASADKLKREIQDFGFPPKFPEKKPVAEGEPEPPAYQWDILRKMGFEDPDEIQKFRDPLYWLSYFPPRAIDDLKQFGVCCDFRRSFITTDVNPYFDSFVRWQFNHLRAQDRIKFGKRYAIYAPREKQMCADHDRLSGEGVKPQEYTIVKMRVVAPFVDALQHLQSSGKNIFFGAATLRPETMYGQTNCWLLAEGVYGAFQINETDVLILTERSAQNLAYQGYSLQEGVVTKLGEFTGQQLFGSALESPLAVNKVIYCLPMMTVSTNKTTGVVTSVPSDSPDDYAAFMELRKKDKLREKFGIRDEWIMPFELVDIINVPEYGDRIAETLCQKLKIETQKSEKLKEAKDEAYLKGFNLGTMLLGEYRGQPVKDAKPLIRQKLIDEGLAIPYAEPESVVVSRSGETCVVALLDQWFLNYGEESWKQLVLENLRNFRYYNKSTERELADTVDWLHEWGCSRSYGLGTRLPWDNSVAIESLSDSTIYMAYYTVAHLLQGGELNGSQVGPSGIRADQLTQQVWDHIIYGKELTPGDDVPTVEQLAPLRREFQYWYPVDMRVSGKDLIKNHLTFFLYNHVAMFEKENWPKSIYCNGWVMVNGEKMSKSRGNFLTMQDIVNLYSADAARIALADAGDTHDDANFVELTANSSVLKLTTHLKWIEDTLQTADQTLRQGNSDTLSDKVFESRLNLLIEQTTAAYDNMMYKNVILAAWYDLQSALKTYITSCADSNEGLNRELVMRYIEVQTILMAPITPHMSEHIWANVLHREGSVLDATWPQVGKIDKILLDQQDYLEHALHGFRGQLAKDKKKLKKPQTKALIYVADKFTEMQSKTLEVLRNIYDENVDLLKDSKIIAERVGKVFGGDKKTIGLAMSFAAFKQDSIAKQGRAALDATPPFDERALLMQNMRAITSAVGCEAEIYSSLDVNAPDPSKRRASAVPGNAQIAFVTD